MKIVLLICGDRNWTDKAAILNVLSAVRDQTEVVIHGAARGADTLAGEVARELGMDVLEFPAEWKKHGKSAGPRRNQRMLAEGKPHMVIAFHDDIENSRGTKDMCRRARNAGIPVRVISHETTISQKGNPND